MNIQTFFIALSGLILFASAQPPKPSYARTMLKVSRSLPGETEELKVRTSEGDVATLIVKRREKSGTLERTNSPSVDPALPRAVHLSSSSKNITNVNEMKSAEKVGEKQPTLFKAEAQTSQNSDSKMDYGSWTPLDVLGRALMIAESTTEHYLNWKPLLTDRQDDTEQNHGLIFGRNFKSRKEKGLDLNDDERFAFIAHQPRPKVRTNIGANAMKNRGGKNVPPEITVRSEINVKHSGKRMPMTIDSDGTPVVHGQRVPDDENDKVQTWRNARVINNKLVTDSTITDTTKLSTLPMAEGGFERFFQDVNRRYGRNFNDDQQHNVYFEWDPKAHRNAAMKADIYETRNENYHSNIQKRMLHPEGTQTYPISPVYTPESQKIAPLALKPGARAPVLQYAHPELGVQPARILKSEKRRPDNFPENQNSFTEQRHKKKYVLNDKSIVDTYNTKNYYPNHQFYGLKQHVEPPFWIKISEKLRNQFSTGVERVSQLTKPVIDPLVEATQKISANLGLSKSHEAQDKIGTVASGTSILIPALGLVASGAALGIGAVAVGRYLDVDMLKRSYKDRSGNERTLVIFPEDLQQLQEKVLKIYPKLLDLERLDSLQKNEDTYQSQEQKTRQKRNLDNVYAKKDNHLTIDQMFRRTGPDSITDIIEIDGPIDHVHTNTFVLVNDEKARKLSSTDSRMQKSASVSDEDFQNLEYSKLPKVTNANNGDWTHTSCAKKMFCDAMLEQGLDSYSVMEKKMESYFKLITQPGAAQQVFNHFQEVTEAVRKHDCLRFSCPKAKPENVF